MREIKFRAWDKCSKKFVYLTLKHGRTAPFLEFEGGVMPPDIFELAEWQQFTGLRDKNGKEIYEGDVLRFPYAFATQKHCAESRIVAVEFQHGAFIAPPMIGPEFQDSKIIGNIYENPELLKPKTEGGENEKV